MLLAPHWSKLIFLHFLPAIRTGSSSGLLTNPRSIDGTVARTAGVAHSRRSVEVLYPSHMIQMHGLRAFLLNRGHDMNCQCRQPSIGGPFVLIGLLLCLTPGISTAQSADSELPAGWRNLAAEDFLEATSRAGASDIHDLAQHAWSKFLSDPEFVAKAKWSTVLETVERYADRAEIVGVDRAARESLDSRLEQRFLQDPQFIASQQFNAMRRIGASLGPGERASAIRAALFVRWMEANDWKTLPLRDLHALLAAISVDRLDRRSVSVRWSGTLSPPADGEYVLRQVRQYSGNDSHLVVRVAGETVLDSTDANQGDARFVSKPLSLAASQPVAVEVSMVHQSGAADPREGSPMAILTWERQGGEATIIPTTAFKPPQGIAGPKDHGLKGEFFAGSNFEDLKASRIDPAVACSWARRPMAPVHAEHVEQVLTAIRTELLDADFRSLTTPPENQKFLADELGGVLHFLTATDRYRFVQQFGKAPEALAVMSPHGMADLLQAVYMLPGDSSSRLLGEWSMSRPQPVCQPGLIVGTGEETYRHKNLEPYRLMGMCFQGPYWSRLEPLWDKYGVGPQQECNLPVAYLAAFATAHAAQQDARSRRTGRATWLDSRIQQQWEDNALPGDAKVTWLIARAYAAEATPSGRPNLSKGLEFLQEAMMTADNDEYRFWALEEIAARQISLASVSQLDQLLEQWGARFRDPDKRSQLAKWQKQAAELQAAYEARAELQRRKSDNQVLTELKRRHERALGRGDEARAARYQQLIESAHSTIRQE